MARTAPSYTGTPSYVIVSFRWIDANGNKTSTAYLTTLARATVANIENLASALGDASNANLYDIVLETHTDAVASAAAASDTSRESANDYINTLVRDPVSRKTQEVSIPAPIDGLFVAGTNTVDVTDVGYQDVNTAANLLLPDAYQFVSVRFSEHRKSNVKTTF